MFFKKITSSKLFFIATGKVHQQKTVVEKEKKKKTQYMKMILQKTSGIITFLEDKIKSNLGAIITIIFISIMIAVIVFLAKDSKNVTIDPAYQKAAEQAYFEGQKDALNNDIRIN